MKILFYNIGYGTGLNGSWRQYLYKLWRYLWSPISNIKRISRLLKDKNIDILCLAEVDTGSIRQRFFSQLNIIADFLGFKYFKSFPKYHPKSLFRFIPLMRKQHDAILTRKKGKIVNHYLKNGTKKLIQELIVDNISIFTVHLSVLRSKLRRIQLEEMAKIIKKCKNPQVLCGDFNIFKGIQEIQAFIKETGLKIVDIPPSFPSCKPTKRLDLFFVSPKIEVNDFGVIADESSDHLPVWIEIEPIKYGTKTA